MKGKDLHPRSPYPAKLSFRMAGQIKYFPGKVKLKEFIITKPLLYERLRDLSKKKKIKNVNIKKAINSQLSTTESKKAKKQKTKQTKQTARTGTESEKWRSHEGFSAGMGRRQNGGKGTGNKKHK